MRASRRLGLSSKVWTGKIVRRCEERSGRSTFQSSPKVERIARCARPSLGPYDDPTNVYEAKLATARILPARPAAQLRPLLRPHGRRGTAHGDEGSGVLGGGTISLSLPGLSRQSSAPPAPEPKRGG